MIIGGSASQKLAANVAKELDDVLCPVETKKFPDGEKYLRINGELEKEVTVIQSTGYPQDENLVELLFLLQTLKELKVEEIHTVIPYLGYGRQEMRFKNYESISAAIVCNLIEHSGASDFLSINLHEDSVRDFFNIPAKNISAMPPIADYVKDNLDNPVIIAPDKGAAGFAEEIADIIGCSYDYMLKTRKSPTEVETVVNELDVEGKDALIVDDIIATGGTIVNCSNILQANGANSVTVSCVHPVLVNDAVSKIFASGVRDIVATDTLKSDVSSISVAKIIADNI